MLLHASMHIYGIKPMLHSSCAAEYITSSTEVCSLCTMETLYTSERLLQLSYTITHINRFLQVRPDDQQQPVKPHVLHNTELHGSMLYIRPHVNLLFSKICSPTCSHHKENFNAHTSILRHLLLVCLSLDERQHLLDLTSRSVTHLVRNLNMHLPKEQLDLLL